MVKEASQAGRTIYTQLYALLENDNTSAWQKADQVLRGRAARQDREAWKGGHRKKDKETLESDRYVCFPHCADGFIGICIYQTLLDSIL